MSPPIHVQEREAQVLKALDRVIAQGPLRLHYQGQYELAHGQLMGLEVFSRLDDPLLGEIPADEFIQLAEKTDRISAWEKRVWQQLQIEWPQLDLHWPQIRLALNFSMRHVTEDSFFESFHQWLKQFDPAHQQRLDFEITETWIQTLRVDQIQELKRLQNQGLQIVMDDFGVGQSSLSRLHQLPFDCLKLDKSFTRDVSHPTVQAIVQAMVKLSEVLNKTLIVEGVETTEQFNTLKSLGVKIVQGFWLGKPQPLSVWLSQAKA